MTQTPRPASPAAASASRQARALPVYRLFLMALVAIGTLGGVVQGSTLASYSSTASSTADTFTAGSVALTAASSAAPFSAAVSNLVPGDVVVAPITVQNTGTLALRYAVASSVTNADGKGLGAQMALTVKSGVTTCTVAGFNSDGTVVYGPDGQLGTTGGIDILGTTAAFPNGGRALAAGASEALCFQVSVPAGTAATFQSAATTATFAFVAQQQ